MQNLTGIPVSRWIDGVLEDPDNMDNPDKVRAMVLVGPRAKQPNTRMTEMKTAMEKLDMMVVIDPYPTVSAVMQDRTDGVYLAACRRHSLKRVALSPRQTGRSSGVSKVVDPLFECKTDHEIIALCLRRSLDFHERIFRNIEVGRRRSDAKRARVTRCARSIAACGTIGYTGQVA